MGYYSLYSTIVYQLNINKYIFLVYYYCHLALIVEGFPQKPKLYNLDAINHHHSSETLQIYHYFKQDSLTRTCGLNKILHEFETQKCLILADNFANANIAAPSYPLILRTYSTGKISIPQKPNIFLWIDPKFSKYQSSITNFNNKLRYGWPDLSVTINQITFASHAKPWNCKVHLSPFLAIRPVPRHAEYLRGQGIIYPKIFSCCTNRNQYLYLLPSTRPTITAFVIENINASKSVHLIASHITFWSRFLQWSKESLCKFYINVFGSHNPKYLHPI